MAQNGTRAAGPRCIALVGPFQSGKTTLLEAILARTGAVARQGMTLVPLSIYFNARGRAKVELAIARGRKAHDKREHEKEKDWKKEQGRLLRRLISRPAPA